jgi:thiamine-monophosphate kinase
MNFREKDFIQEVMGPFATTASADGFDDAVVIDLAEITGRPDADFLVYSMDQPSMIPHADPDLDPFRFYGRWVAGTTCNDIIAMGARCRGFSLALAAPPEAEVGDLQSMLRGISDVLAQCGATYEGGNLDSGELSTVGFAWGLAPRLGLVRRSGARPGDVIAVTGELGLGWLEYQFRTHGLSDQIDPADRDTYRRYKAMPVGAAAAVAAVARRGWLTSGMDLSDGLVEFLYTIRRRSGLGCVIDGNRLPVSQAARRNVPLLEQILDPASAAVLRCDPALVALEPGYDSALRHAFTVTPSALMAAQEIFAVNDAELHPIGEVTSSQSVLLRRADTCVEIPEFWDDKLRQDSVLADWASFLTTFA